MSRRTNVRSKPAQVEAISAGVDWLTMTVPYHAQDAGWWQSRASECLVEVKEEGHQMRPSTMLGYAGWRCGGCFVGERMDDRMVQFSGSYADRFYERLYRKDAHFSRVDLRVDVKFSEMPATIAKKGYASALRANSKLPASRRRKIYILMGSDGGDTLYIGSPTSEQRGRLYNKEVQSEDSTYTRTWRYECMYRNDAARAAIDAIIGLSGDTVGRIKSVVATWYNQRGIYTGHFAGSETVTLPIARTLPSDVEKRLVWLKSQVAPALRMLREHGALNEALEALDLPSRDEG